MSSEMQPEKGPAALNDRLFATFYDGLELILSAGSLHDMIDPACDSCQPRSRHR
jgi:hypothetical protein